MKTKLFWLLTLLLLGCQQQPTHNASSHEAPDHDHSQTDPQPFADSDELLAVRLTLHNHLIHVENITAVPLADSWTPQQTYLDTQKRHYSFSSSDWQLQIELPLTADAPYRYRTLITGPDNFHYAADLSPNGLVYPAQ